MHVPSLPLPLYESLVPVKGNFDRKKITEKLDFVENSSFIRGSTEACFRGCSTEIHRKKPVTES